MLLTHTVSTKTGGVRRSARLDVCIYNFRWSDSGNKSASVLGSTSIQIGARKRDIRKNQRSALLERGAARFVLDHVGCTGMAGLHVRCVSCKSTVW